ncbi:MAG: 2-hydroxyglutaryl-CoA dehydratase [Candidatus Lokiarchaeota archaeon]|nr:2-hydroxyglutaryl-CoA dehydratase [Candidatus Lokiarchaeota archaeon]
MYNVGIDIGSLVTKIVLLNNDKLQDFLIDRSSYQYNEVGNSLFNQILTKNRLKKEQISHIMSTGYGRHSLDIADQRITEISAHARGVQFYFPNALSIIDIGGQDSKVIKIEKNSGKIVDFQMNDKCAAGTGRFLEVMAQALDIPLQDLGNLALKSNSPEKVSSTCTVFAESEVIGLFSQGKKKEDIAMGIHISIAKRVGAMAKRINVESPLVFCGGVAWNVAVRKALEEEIGFPIFVPENPQITGALGAALITYEQSIQNQ